MTQTSRRARRAAIALLAAAGLLACDERAAPQATVDSALASDLAMASQSDPSIVFADTALSESSPERARSAPAPARRDPAPRPAPTPRPRPDRAAPSPAPTPTPTPTPAPMPAAQPAPQPSPIGPGIAAGTAVSLATNQQMCTDNRPGDKITATLSAPIVGTGGIVVPAGAKVVLELASTTHGTDDAEPRLAFRVRAIIAEGRSWPVNIAVATTPALDKTRRNSPGSDRKKVIGGAVAGAVLGQVLGKDTKSTVIGAAAGAAAGAGAAVATSHYVGCLSSGSALTFTVAERVELAAG